MVTQILILILVILAFYIDKAKKNVQGIRKIPGPPPLPFIGNILDIGTNTVDILIKFRKLTEKYGSIVRLWIGSNLYILLSEPTFIGQLLTGNNAEKSKLYDLAIRIVGNGLVTSSGEKWRVDRRLLSPYFNNARVAQFMPALNKSANDVIEKVKRVVSAGPVDITEIIYTCTFNAICNTTMGADLSLNMDFQGALNWVEANIVNRNFSLLKQFDWFYQFTQDCKTEQEKTKILHSYTKSVISERRKERIRTNNREKRTTLLDDMLDLSEQTDWFTDQDLQNQGYDTIAATVNYGLFELAKHPDIQTKILEETNSVLGDNKDADLSFENLTSMKYTDSVFKEIVRVFSPVPIIERKLIKDTHFGEHTLPKGATIIIYFGGAQSSVNNFRDPEKFIPERFLTENRKNIPQYAFIPFSTGPRNCIGQKFGAAQAKLLLAKFVRNFQIEAVQPEHIPQFHMALVTKSSNGLPIKLTKR